MNIKIIAIVFVLGVVLAISVIARPFSFEKQTPARESVERPTKKQTENRFKSPLTWLEESARGDGGEQSPLSIITNSQNSLPKIIKENTHPLPSLNQPPQKIIQPSLTAKEIENYYLELLNARQSSGGFTTDEFATIRKDESGRPLFPEELFNLAQNNDNIDTLKFSFIAWQRLAETYFVNLQEMKIGDALQPTHQALINWAEYFSGVNKSLGSGNLSKTEINDLIIEYRQRAKIELPKIQRTLSLKEPTMSVIVNKFLSLAPKVFAQGQTATCDFGGPIRSYSMFCCNGLVWVVTPPPGKNFCGALMFDYVMTIYYNYENFSIGACVLGKARRGPGVCNNPAEDCIPNPAGSAAVMYFGSAPTLTYCKSTK
jgi:hypothetical protein